MPGAVHCWTYADEDPKPPEFSGEKKQTVVDSVLPCPEPEPEPAG